MRILVVEDDPDIQEILKFFLEDNGYVVDIADDGVQGISMFRKGTYDMILLDVMLPKVDGFAVCEIIRVESQVPIIMITALTNEEDQIKGFNCQADDYITKPFSMPILLKKIEAIFRRSQNNNEEKKSIYTYADLQFDVDNCCAFISGDKVELTKKESELLEELLINQGNILTRQSLLNRIWKYEFMGNERVVDNHIKNLRKKLGIDYIKTVRGVGYKIDKLY